MTQKTKTAGRKPGKRDRSSTRREILDCLKLQGPKDAGALAAQFGLSAMAIRQHLYDLQDQRLVDYLEAPRPVGRPAKLWRLTPAADRFFPDGHAELTLSLLDAMGESFGEKGFDRLLATRTRQQIESYGRRVKAGAPLKARLTALAKIRTEEGYMAEVRRQGRNEYLLVEHHCPICTAAAACSGLCAAELAVFRGVLGDDVEIERSDHILAGARRCAYRVRKRPRQVKS